MFRQGDVLIIPLDVIPEQERLEPVGRDEGRLVLAHGEMTGHAHIIETEGAALFRDPIRMAVFLIVTGDPVMLEHDEHDTVVLPPGNYRVVRQREYSPEEIVNVTD